MEISTLKARNSIKKNAGFVNKFLKKELKGNPKQLYDAASHLILHGGKRLRPFLVLKSCQMLGGKQSDAIAAASAVEIFLADKINGKFQGDSAATTPTG